jgi:hypothetical protein
MSVQAYGDALFDSFGSKRVQMTLGLSLRELQVRSKRLSAKYLSKVGPTLLDGEVVEVLDKAFTLNPWWDVLLVSPTFVLLFPSVSNAVTISLFVFYFCFVGSFLRERTRLVVFTDLRILVFVPKGRYGSKYELSRELPKIASPITNFHGWWKRFDALDERMFIART